MTSALRRFFRELATQLRCLPADLLYSRLDALDSHFVLQCFCCPGIEFRVLCVQLSNTSFGEWCTASNTFRYTLKQNVPIAFPVEVRLAVVQGLQTPRVRGLCPKLQMATALAAALVDDGSCENPVHPARFLALTERTATWTARPQRRLLMTLAHGRMNLSVAQTSRVGVARSEMSGDRRYSVWSWPLVPSSPACDQRIGINYCRSCMGQDVVLRVHTRHKLRGQSG